MVFHRRCRKPASKSSAAVRAVCVIRILCLLSSSMVVLPVVSDIFNASRVVVDGVVVTMSSPLACIAHEGWSKISGGEVDTL